MRVKFQKIVILLSIAIFVLSVANLAHATPTLAPTSTIPSISGNLAYDSGQNEIFVQHGSEYATISIISDKTNKVVATITGALSNGYNGEVVYDSGKGEIFAALGNARKYTPSVITVISDSTNKFIANITFASPGNSAYNWPYEPYGMAYDSGKGEIFVTDVSGSNVYVISDKTNSVVATVQVGRNPNPIIYDSGMNEVFVVNTGSGNISVISDKTNTVNATINLAAGAIAYDPGKSEVFVSTSSGVSVISDKTNKVVANITGITTGFTTMAYDSAKGEIFVGSQVISDANNTVVAQLPVGLSGEVVYDSGKGEVIGVTKTGLSIFSDSSSIKPTQTTGSLRVDVKDSSGGVLSGVAVSSTSQPSGQTKLSETTGSDGSVTISNVAAGAYTLQASKSGYVTGTGTGSVVAGSSASISITLQAQPSSGGGGGIPGFSVEATVLGIILVVVVLSIRKRSSS